MVLLGSHCWIGQEEIEQQTSPVGSKRVQGVRVSDANSCWSDVRKAKPWRETAPEGWCSPRVAHWGWEQHPPDHKTSPHLPHPHHVVPYSTTEHILQAFILLWRNDPIRFQDENLPIKWLFYRENCCAHAVSVQDMSISANRAGGFGNGDTGLFGAGWTSLILFHYTTEQIVDVNYFSH